MKLSQISYGTNFYWKGNKYIQVIRPKNPKGKFTIVCRPANDPCAKWIDMPSGRNVKPVLSLTEYKEFNVQL